MWVQRLCREENRGLVLLRGTDGQMHSAGRQMSDQQRLSVLVGLSRSLPWKRDGQAPGGVSGATRARDVNEAP